MWFDDLGFEGVFLGLLVGVGIGRGCWWGIVVGNIGDFCGMDYFFGLFFWRLKYRMEVSWGRDILYVFV